MKKRKVLLNALAVACMASMLTACSSGSNTASSAATSAKSTAAAAESAASGAASEAASAAESAASGAASEAASAAESAASGAASEAASAAESAASEAASAAASAAESAVSEAASAAASAAESAVSEAASAATSAAESAVSEAASAAASAAESAASEAASAATSAAESAVSEAASAAASVAESVAETESAAAPAEAASGLYESPLYPTPEGVTLKPASYNEAAPDWTEYDKLIAEIKSNIPADERVAKMHQAEDILMETGAVIPIYYYNDLYLQQTDVDGIYSNLFGFKYFQNATLPRDVLKINLASEPAKLDPALNSSVDGACIIVNTFSGLYAYDENEQLVPACADETNPYEVSEDGLTYTFHLKDGLTWSDGSPLTAGDFEYAWKRAANPETGADYGYLFTDTFAYDGDEIDVKATDDKTLVATLNAPCAYFLDLAAFPAFYPVPQAAVEAADPTGVNPGAWASEAGFVSNGAYTVDDWSHEESLTLTKNPNWYAAETVGPEKIEMMLSADDTAIYAAYNSGDLDFADTVPTNEIEAIKANDDFHVVDNLGTYYVAFNVNSDLFEGKTVEQAANMRKAFAILIDRDYIIENVGQTEQKCANSFIPAGMSDGNGGVFKANTDSYTYPLADEEGYFPEELQDNAVDEAIALLESAGYVFEDGMLSDETPINVTYLTNEGTGHVAIAEAMQQDLAEIGIDMSIETREWNVFLDERKQGHFDFAREGWLADYNDPINMLEMWASNSGNNDCQFGKSAEAVAAEAEAAEEAAESEAAAAVEAVVSEVAAAVDSAASEAAATDAAVDAAVSEVAAALDATVSEAAAAADAVASEAAAAVDAAVSEVAAAVDAAVSEAAAAADTAASGATAAVEEVVSDAAAVAGAATSTASAVTSAAAAQ